MKKIYKVSYANKIEVLEVCYENKSVIFMTLMREILFME